MHLSSRISFLRGLTGFWGFGDDLGTTLAKLGKTLAYSGTLWHTLAYSVILWHTLAYSDILWHTLAYSGILKQTLVYSGIHWHTLACSGILCHTLPYSSILWHAFGLGCHTLAYSTGSSTVIFSIWQFDNLDFISGEQMYGKFVALSPTSFCQLQPPCH